MHPDPALAVVVVCHDNAGEIGITLAALAPQLRAGDEVVIVDNASSDGTSDVARAAAVPAPGCLDGLRACAVKRPEWGAWQALVTMAGGELVNTAGNVVHYLGFGWAGQLGQPVATVDARPHEVGFCSGAALVVRREAWD